MEVGACPPMPLREVVGALERLDLHLDAGNAAVLVEDFAIVRVALLQDHSGTGTLNLE
jgi:hypothetical protein